MTHKIKIIAISGGSGSGKTTAAHYLQQILGNENCKILSQDSYYIDQSLNFKGDGTVNFDHPNAIDFPLMAENLSDLIKNKTIQIPIYDFITHTRKNENILFHPPKILIVDGILILSQEILRPFFTASLFIDIAEETRFKRRLKRDVEERGRQPEGVKKQFYSLVKPMHDAFVQPSKEYATFVATDDSSLKDALEKIKNLVI
ncbi:uridine kinase [Fluviispira multicolorata]|uniref:uridine/cytidine kinase n=1 Tax=Fluviispira multicolorata TaxID=2654512 RepID=A0A833JCE2_9BACT|nr:uridine kinase [Fluviispira multicolorata]KAB8029932.1 uridine kinase [Fluviispira multicolorata]